MILLNQSKNILVANQLEVARTFSSRMKGLLGRKSLAPNEALWIDRCPSIHTLFMQFAIDVVFVDRALTVRACFENVKPWRLVSSIGARSVFELPTGAIKNAKIEVGDKLHVAS